MTLTGDVDAIFFLNSCTTEIIIKLTDVAATELRFPVGASLVFDGRANRKRIRAGTIQVKYAASLPSGSISVLVTK